MLRALALILASILAVSAVLPFAGPALAQPSGSVCVYADPSGTSCNLVDTGPGLLNVYLVVENTPGFKAVEFAVSTPECFTGSSISTTAYAPFGYDPFPDIFTGARFYTIDGTCMPAASVLASVAYFVNGTTPADCPLSILPAQGHATVEITDCADVTGPASGGTAYFNSTLDCDCDVGPTRLSVQPALLDFGNTMTEKTVEIVNAGEPGLNWSISESVDWLAVSETSGTENATITMTADRTGLAVGTYTGVVQVTSNAGSETIDVSMQVGALGVRPSALHFGTGLNGTYLYIQNDGVDPLDWTLTESIPWASLDQTSGTDDASVYVSVYRTGLAAGFYADSIFVDSNGGSAVVAVDMEIRDPVLVLSADSLFFPHDISMRNLDITKVYGGTLTWNIDVSIPWISLNRTSGTDQARINVYVDRADLEPATYSGEILVTSNGGDATVSVEMEVLDPVLFVSPGSFDFGGSEVSEVLNITNAGGQTLNWSVSNSAAWLDVDPSSGTDDADLTVTVDRTGLAAGSYVDTILVASNGGDQTVPVTLMVESPVLSVTPESLDFGLNETAFYLTVANAGGGELSWNVSSSAPWLDASGTNNTTIWATVSRTGLADGAYDATIEVTSNGGNAQVDVSMQVQSAPPSDNTVCLYAEAEGTVCSLTANAGQTMTVHVIHDNTTGATAVNFLAPRPACLNATWMGDTSPFLMIGDSQEEGLALAYAQCLTGPTHVASIAYFVTSAQSDCAYPVLPFPGEAYVRVADCSAENAWATGGTTYINSSIPCICGDTQRPPVLGVHPTLVPIGGSATSGTFDIRNLGEQPMSWSVEPNVDWWSVDPDSGVDGATITITPDRTGILPGTYEGVVYVSSTGGSEVVVVQVDVTQPMLSLTPSSLEFDTGFTERVLTIGNIGTGTLLWSVDESAPWMSASSLTGSMPSGSSQNVTVTVDRTGLPEDIYVDSLIVTSNGGFQTVPVTMSTFPPPVLEVSPGALNFGEDDVSLDLSISNTGSGALEWFVTDDRNWITTSAPAGNGDFTLAVSVNRNGLSPGVQYTGTVSVTSNGGEVDVPVSVDVAEVPILSLDKDSIDLGNCQQAGSFDIINDGTGTLDWSLTLSAPWLGANPVSGVNDTTVQVTVDKTGLAPGTYQGRIDVSSAGGNDFLFVNMEVAPCLLLDATFLHFTATVETLVVNLVNPGGQPVEWTFTDDADWLTFDPATGTDDGQVNAIVDRSGVTDGTYFGTWSVETDAGDLGPFTARLEVASSPRLAVSPGILEFTPMDTIQVLSIQNTGQPTLEWSVTADSSWVSFEPVSGSGDTMVDVEVDYSALGPGGHTVELLVASNGGDETVTVHATRPEFGAPRIAVYFDDGLSRRSFDCPDAPAGTVVQDLYIVASGFAAAINAIEFMVDYPDELEWLGDAEVFSTLSLGDTQSGIAMTWDSPQLFDTPHLIARATAMWQCQACPTNDVELTFLPNPQSGKLRAIEWGTTLPMPVTPGSSYICPTIVDTRPVTWSQIKALMRGETLPPAAGSERE